MTENRSRQSDELQRDIEVRCKRYVDAVAKFKRIKLRNPCNSSRGVTNQLDKSKGKKFKFEEIMSKDNSWIVQNITYIRGILDYMKNKENRHSLRINSPSGSGKTFFFDLLKQLSLPTFERVCNTLGLHQEDKNSIYTLYRDVIVIPLNFNAVPAKLGDDNKDVPIEVELFPEIIKSFIDELTKQAYLSHTQTKGLQELANKLNLPLGYKYTCKEIREFHNTLLDYIYKEISAGRIYKRTLPEYLDGIEKAKKEKKENQADCVIPTKKKKTLFGWIGAFLGINEDETQANNSNSVYYSKREKVTKLIIVIDEVNIRGIRERFTDVLKDSEQHINFYVQQAERLLKNDRHDDDRDKVQFIFSSILPISKSTKSIYTRIMIQDFEYVLSHIHKKKNVHIYPSFGEIKIEWFNHLIQRSRLNNKPNNLTILLDKAEKG